MALIISLAVVTLACAIGGSATPPATEAIARLPTFTPTSGPELPPTAAVSTSPPPAAATPLPAETPTPISTPTPYAGGWIFSGVRQVTDQPGGLQIYGEAVNDSSAAVEVKAITGAFYDDTGQVIADGNTSGRWPAVVVPPGGRIPFALTVPGSTGAVSFDLRVEAQPSSATPRQDFEFLEVTESAEGNATCLAGQLRNPGAALTASLVVGAVLFDSQDKVINYADQPQDAPETLGSGQTKAVKLCVDRLNQNVVRYELRAWGQ